MPIFKNFPGVIPPDPQRLGALPPDPRGGEWGEGGFMIEGGIVCPVLTDGSALSWIANTCRAIGYIARLWKLSLFLPPSE